VLEYLRLVHDLDVDAFVFENVRGLTVGRHQEFLTVSEAAAEWGARTR